MCQKYTEEELNTMNHDAKNAVIYQMQERLDKLEHDYERLIEQIHLADQERFGRHTERLSEIAGQLSFFNEVEACYDENLIKTGCIIQHVRDLRFCLAVPQKQCLKSPAKRSPSE